VTNVDFFPKLSSVAVTGVNGKTMKARKSSKRKAGLTSAAEFIEAAVVANPV